MGAVDGFMQGPVGQAANFGGLVKTVIYPGVYRAGFPVLVNKKAPGDEMSPDQKRLTAFCVTILPPRMDNIWWDAGKRAQGQMIRAGFTLLELPPAEAARYEKIAMDAAWNVVSDKAGADIANELRGMLTNNPATLE